MACQDKFITKNLSIPSRSRLYASDLPGVEDLEYELLSKDSETESEVWERIYRNAWHNLVSDVEVKLREKFFVQYKLVSRETSEFQNVPNANTGLAGVKITYPLSRYATFHIISVKIHSLQDYPSPEFQIKIFDTNENGDLLHEETQEIFAGKNEVFVDQSFDTGKEKTELFVAYDPELFELRSTEIKPYTAYTYWDKFSCRFPCFGGEGSVQQVNGGGLNVIYNVHCSAEKFVCENLNLFAKCLWWRIGMELVIERDLGNRLNQFTTFTADRGEQLMNAYKAQYQQALDNSIKQHNIHEDPICFECKGTVNVATILP